jgi:hypothetical protein
MGVQFWFSNFFEVVHKSRAKITNEANIGIAESRVVRRRAGEPEDELEFVQEQAAVEAG